MGALPSPDGSCHGHPSLGDFFAVLVAGTPVGLRPDGPQQHGLDADVSKTGKKCSPRKPHRAQSRTVHAGKPGRRIVPATRILLVISLLGVGLAAWAVHAALSPQRNDADASYTSAAGSPAGTRDLLGEITVQIEPVLAQSRRVLLGERRAGDPTCITRELVDNRVVLQGSPAGGAGLRIMALYKGSPDTALALYNWSQEKLRPFLKGEREANAAVLAKAERLAVAARDLASQVRQGSFQPTAGAMNVAVTSPAWPAECLRRFRMALVAGDVSSARIWADELAAATFALADLHRWLNVLLDSHLTSLDFQTRCRTAFEWADPIARTSPAEQESCLPASGQMVAWGENYLEVEHQAEGAFAPAATSVAIVESQNLSNVPAARWMPPQLRAAFLSLRSRLSSANRALWDRAAASPFERSYLANMLFRAASCGSLEQMGLVLQRFEQCHAAATMAELMDVLFYRSGLHSSGFPWSDRYDRRIMDAASQVTAQRELAALRAHRLANSLLNGWENYVGGFVNLTQALDAGKFDCVRGTDLVGALYRDAGLGEYFVVRLNCGTVGHSVGAIPIERDGRRHLLILDCLDSSPPSELWPYAYFQGLAWPTGYPGNQGMLFSAELYARGLDGCLFAEGYVVRGEHAGQWVRAALPYLPGAEHADSAKIFAGPYPDSPVPVSSFISEDPCQATSR